MATKEQKILKKILGDYYESNNEMLFSCPFCKHHKKKLSVNIDKNAWKCWVCDSSGRTIEYLVKRFGDPRDLQDWGIDSEITFDDIEIILFGEKTKPEIKEEINLPKEYVPLLTGRKSFLKDRALKYLKQRGLTEKQIFIYKIGICTKGEYKGRVIIPSFNEEGEINYFVARTYENDFLKYKNPNISKSKIIFNELLIDFDKPVFIVEGIFDAIRIGKNSVPILGSTIKKEDLIFKKIVENRTPIYIGLDQDAKSKEEKIIKLFLSYGIEVKKINTTGYTDIAEMPKDVLTERIEQALDMGGVNLIYRLLGEVA